MVLESTMICFDNSDYQRNGDYFPTRLNVQKDGINLIGLTKVRSNPENNVGLLTYASSVEVLATLTSDIGRILSKMHLVQPKGNINIITGVRIAHLVLKHRQGKNHKMRIVVFVGSPIQSEEGDLVKLAKRLKKEKVNVDIVSFGEHVGNHELLTAFITTINGKDGNSSHLVTVPRGSTFPEALISSPIIRGEDGLGAAGISQAGYEFGVDPNEDPELALALRVSMEEQRQRQEAEQRRAIAESDTGASASTPGAVGSIGTASAAIAGAAAVAGAIDIDDPDDEEAMLQRALALSTDDVTVPISIGQLDFTNMSEEEQIAIAMQMSMHDQHDPTPAPAAQPKRTKPEETPMEVDEVITDPDFLQSVLESLPGVDPHSDAVRDAVELLKDTKKNTGDKKDTDTDKK